MEVKDIIRTYREKLNLTMKQLANRVGVSEGTIRWLEWLYIVVC